MSGFHQAWTDPSYPTCPICEEESDDDRGWCSRCEDFVSNQPVTKPLPPVRGTVRQIMERIQSRERFEWHISDDGKSGRIAA